MIDCFYNTMAVAQCSYVARSETEMSLEFDGHRRAGIAESMGLSYSF